MSILPIFVDTDSPINIKAQIIAQVKRLVALNELKSGDILPTVVEFAKHLGVNHNTVANVYNELTESGYLVAIRGKGTFVSDNEIVSKSKGQQHIYTLLSEAYNTASQFGLSAAEFGAAAYSQALSTSHSSTVSTPLKVVFLATEYDGENLCNAIKDEIGVPVSFIPWSKKKAKNKNNPVELKTAELIITIPQLLWSVTKIVAPEQEVFALDVKPDFKLLIHLSSLPRHYKLMLVGKNQAESEVMKVCLELSGIHHLNFQTIENGNILKSPEILEDIGLLILSPSLIENNSLWQSAEVCKVMVFNFRLDSDNISLLKARLATIQSERLISLN